MVSLDSFDNSVTEPSPTTTTVNNTTDKTTEKEFQPENQITENLEKYLELIKNQKIFETTSNLLQKIEDKLEQDSKDEEKSKLKDGENKVKSLMDRISVVSGDQLRSLMIEISSLINDPSLPLEIKALLFAAISEVQYEIRIDEQGNKNFLLEFLKNSQENDFIHYLAEILNDIFEINDEISELEESGALTLYDEGNKKVKFNELLRGQKTEISRVDYDSTKDPNNTINSVKPKLIAAIQKIENTPAPEKSSQQDGNAILQELLQKRNELSDILQKDSILSSLQERSKLLESLLSGINKSQAEEKTGWNKAKEVKAAGGIVGFMAENAKVNTSGTPGTSPRGSGQEQETSLNKMQDTNISNPINNDNSQNLLKAAITIVAVIDIQGNKERRIDEQPSADPHPAVTTKLSSTQHNQIT